MNAIALRGIRRTCFGFGNGAQGIDLEIEQGEIIALVGPSGAGKTTLLHLMMGLLRPDEGTVRAFGLDPWIDSLEFKRRLGYVQEAPVFVVSKRAVVESILRIRRPLFATWDRQLEAELLEHFELKTDLRVSKLDKKQLYRLALVCALAHRPSLLVIDDPTRSHSLEESQELLRVAIEKARAAGATIVIASRDPSSVSALADGAIRNVLLHDGRILSADLASMRLSEDATALPPKRDRLQWIHRLFDFPPSSYNFGFFVAMAYIQRAITLGRVSFLAIGLYSSILMIGALLLPRLLPDRWHGLGHLPIRHSTLFRKYVTLPSFVAFGFIFTIAAILTAHPIQIFPTNDKVDFEYHSLPKESERPERSCQVDVPVHQWRFHKGRDPIRVQAPSGESAILHAYPIYPGASLSIYNPYSITSDSTATFAAWQLSRAYEDENGIHVSPEKLLNCPSVTHRNNEHTMRDVYVCHLDFGSKFDFNVPHPKISIGASFFLEALDTCCGWFGLCLLLFLFDRPMRTRGKRIAIRAIVTLVVWTLIPLSIFGIHSYAHKLAHADNMIGLWHERWDVLLGAVENELDSNATMLTAVCALSILIFAVGYAILQKRYTFELPPRRQDKQLSQGL